MFSTQSPDHLSELPLAQDGFAVRVADGAGDFEVEFEAFTGTAQKVLSPGKVAYIGTGQPMSSTFMT